jgi:hypothetical protein
MVLIAVVGRDLACFWSGRAFGGEFGYEGSTKKEHGSKL